MNGQSRVPPGFRFHPTEEELLSHYLRKKVANENIDLDVIREVDLNKLEPWDIQEECRIGSTPQHDWYFFSHRDKKYPTGTRTNRATTAGFWKATGRDKVIRTSAARIGMRKTLVFYKGRAPHGQKSDWIMHEYRLNDPQDDITQHNVICGSFGELIWKEEGWVVCRMFKKKNVQKAFDGNSSLSMICNRNGTIDHSLQYMGRSHKQEGNLCSNNITNPTTLDDKFHENFITLPALQSPSNIPLNEDLYSGIWSSYDQLVESQVNGLISTTDMDLWTMTTTLL